jgi:hypothetical protein
MRKTLFLLLALSLAVVPGFSQKFAFKLSSGMSWADGGDLTTGIQGQSDLLKQVYGLGDTFLAPKNGVQISGEFLFYPWKFFGVGLGVGQFKMSKDSSAAYTNNYLSTTEAIKPAVTVTPVTLNLHLLLPLTERLRFDATAGAGIYFTKLDWNFRADYTVLGLSGYDEYTFLAKKSAFGVQAGIGLEYLITSRLSLVANGLYRSVKLDPYTGTYTSTGGGDFGSYTSTGTDASFWYFEHQAGGTTFPLVAFQVDQPAVTPWDNNARQARIDLKGFTVTLGLKVAFGR